MPWVGSRDALSTSTPELLWHGGRAMPPELYRELQLSKAGFHRYSGRNEIGNLLQTIQYSEAHGRCHVAAFKPPLRIADWHESAAATDFQVRLFKPCLISTRVGLLLHGRRMHEV